MTYEEAVEYILDIPRFTKKNRPEDVKRFLELLGNPQDRPKVIHVAGTNGKGSVCVYLDAMLRSEGKSTGLFTSPHLVRMNERIVINGQQISDEMFVEVFLKVKAAADRMREEGAAHPTFFEFLFAMAAAAFAQAKTEYVVLETGLGGRLDATNCVRHPVCSVITSIGLDHMEILGDTVEKIAAEKAGILKPQVPVFFWDSGQKSSRVIEERAAALGISCNKIGKNAFKILGIRHKYIAFSCTNAYYEDTTWRLHNTGIYQPENAVLAMEVMRALPGFAKHPARWREALSQVSWAGRMEEVLPGVYIDGAHNLSAIERFAESVSEEKTEKILLFSAVKDKDYTPMIECLCSKVDAAYYVVTHISDKRAEDTETLAGVFRAHTEKPVFAIESIKEAWSYIKEHREGETVYCLGSLYLAGMIRGMLKEEGKC